jgi:hypothetical protein
MSIPNSLRDLQRFAEIVGNYVRHKTPPGDLDEFYNLARALRAEASRLGVPEDPFSDALTNWWRCNDPELRRALTRLEGKLLAEELRGTSNGSCADEDGPAEPGRWRYEGELVPGRMRPKAWALAAELWPRRPQEVDYLNLIEPVYGPHEDPSRDAFDSLAKSAREFFGTHGVPLTVKRSGNKFSLRPTW